MPKLPVFLDSNLLSIFTEINRLDLLLALFAEHDLHVSPSVRSELITAVERGRRHIQKALDLMKNGDVILTTPPSTSEHLLLNDLPNWMADGEAECIVVCQSRGWVFASFDRRATNYCFNHDILSLTLNQVLAALWKQGVATKDEVRIIIDEIEQSGRSLRSSEQILQDK